MTVNNNCTITEEDFCNSNPGATYQFDGDRTTYTCPDGYNLNSTYTQCARAAGTSATGGDARGNYTITYESCAPQRDSEFCVFPHSCTADEDCGQCL